MMVPSENTQQRIADCGFVDCIVAFLDILGLRSKVLESNRDGDTLEKIIQSLQIMGRFPTGDKSVSGSSGERRTIEMRSRFFSDTLLFFLREKAEDVAHLFFVIRFLQDQLWEKGICLRGSIVRGPMYWSEKDDRVTLGDALICAHEQESTIAIFPRIIVSAGLFDYIETNKIAPDPFGGSGAHKDLKELVRRDSDGIHFLDLLNPGITRPEGECLKEEPNGHGFAIRYDPQGPSRHGQVVSSVERVVKRNMKSKEPRIRQKYEWLRTYRDVFKQ